MKLLILKENFKKGLDVVCKLAAKSFSLPVLNNVLLEAEKNFLCLTATDLEIAIRYWVLAKTEKEGKITVPAKFLASLVSCLSESQLSLEGQNKTLTLVSENLKTEVKGIAAEDFPIIPKVEQGDFLELNAQPFCQGLAQVMENSAVSQSRPELTGVYLSFQKELVIMAATDSFRLAEKKLFFGRTGGLAEKTLILPAKTCRELVSVVSEKTKKMKIYFGSNQIMFELKTDDLSHPQLQIVSRLLEGEYPNYQEIIPRASRTEIVLDREKFLERLKTASLFSGRINEVRIDINLQEQKIEISALSQDVGEARSWLPCQIKGQDGKVCFNWRFLIDGVTTMQSKEFFWGLNGEEGPAILKPVGDPSFIYIAMPIKSS